MLAVPDLASFGGASVVTSRATALTLSFPSTVQVVITGGYYAKGDGGDGLYSSVAVEPAHAGKFQDARGRWFELVTSEPTPRQFGAVGDNVADDSQPIQNAVDYAAITGCRDFLLQDGQYFITTSILIGMQGGVDRSGIRIRGSSRDSSRIRSATAAYVMVWGSSGFDNIEGPQITNLRLDCINGIQFNDPTVTIADGAGENPIMNVVVQYCDIVGNGSVGSYGIQGSKLFDYKIENNLVQSFDTNVAVQGCDIGTIGNNRVVNSLTYGVLVMSAGSFGSQNRVIHNDILCGVSGTAIKSCDRHVSIVDNYMEIRVGGHLGAIDVSLLGLPVFGANVPTLPLSISVLDNRVDGQDNCTTFVGRYDVDDSRSTIIRSRQSSGVPAPVVPASFFVGARDSAFGRADIYRNRTMSVNDITFGKLWHGYDSKLTSDILGTDVVITPSSVGAVVNVFNNDLVEFTGKDFIVPSGVAATSVFVLSTIFGRTASDNANVLFEAGLPYTATIRARTTNAGGDGVEFEWYYLGRAMGFATVYTVTDEYQDFIINFNAPAATEENVGIAFRRATAVGDLLISSVSFSPAFQTFADNAAALAGGLVVGNQYKTATGEVRVVV